MSKKTTTPHETVADDPRWAQLLYAVIFGGVSALFTYMTVAGFGSALLTGTFFDKDIFWMFIPLGLALSFGAGAWACIFRPEKLHPYQSATSYDPSSLGITDDYMRGITSGVGPYSSLYHRSDDH